MLQVGDAGRIWFDAGRLYLVEIEGGAAVAEVLYGAGAAPLEEIESMLTDPGASVGSALATRYPDTAPVLARLLHEHNLNGLFELLMPGEVTTEFTSGTSHPVGSAFGDSVVDLVDQVDRRLEVWRKIATRISSTGAAFRLAPVLPDGGEERLITADEWRYLALLDGTRSVADVVAETKQSGFRVTSTLYRLLLEGLIEESA